MRIALVSTLASPVCQRGSGSVEGMVWLLSRELTDLGHEVTVFATAGSEPVGRLVPSLPGPYGQNGAPGDWQMCEWINLCRAVQMSADFDVVHSHSYLFGMPLQSLCRAPLVNTTHVVGAEDYARTWRAFPEAAVTAVSHFQWSSFPDLRPLAVIPHGVDGSEFAFRREPQDYVCFLGRFIPGKGPLVAIEAARALGVRLLLAGPWSPYFEEHVRPLVDGRSVEYVGWVAGPERSELLGGARALLYPLAEPESFGLVQVEAMMCGTPVAAIACGAVPEIVEPEVTGAIAATAGTFCDAVGQAMRVDRETVRNRAFGRFASSHMARGYEDVYRRVVARRTREAGHDGAGPAAMPPRGAREGAA